MLIYAKVSRNDGEYTEERIYTDRRHFYYDIGEDDRVICSLKLSVRGRDYQHKQDNARELAIDFQQLVGESADVQLSYLEWAWASDFFTKLGKRFGLLREFRENAII